MASLLFIEHDRSSLTLVSVISALFPRGSVHPFSLPKALLPDFLQSLLKYQLLSETHCNIVIYKKYSHADDPNIFLRYIWFSHTVLGSQLPNPQYFLMRATEASLLLTRWLLDPTPVWELVASRSQPLGKRIGTVCPTSEVKGLGWGWRLTHHQWPMT